jgi:radical SAM protein with 4Fe4S-binding SPASM domain
MSGNRECLGPLLDLCAVERVKRFKLHGYIPSGRSSQELAEVPKPDDVRRAVMALRGIEEKDPAFSVTYPCYTNHMEEATARAKWRVGVRATGLSCGAGSTRGVIWEDGSVGACEFFRAESVGDLRAQSFDEIWAGGNENIERWRRLDRVGGKCGSCGYQADCGFGCRAIAHYSGGDFYGGDPSCISEPPPGEVHPYDLVKDKSDEFRTRRFRLPVVA